MLCANCALFVRFLTFLIYSTSPQRLADSYLAAQNASNIIKKGTWQHDLLGECRTNLATRPVKAQALLFYSQYPDGSPNFLTKHGGCPVIRVSAERT